MNSENLLNIDVDKLFEKHNVHEIDEIHRKIEQEMENKKEHLKVMVSLWIFGEFWKLFYHFVVLGGRTVQRFD